MLGSLSEILKAVLVPYSELVQFLWSYTLRIGLAPDYAYVSTFTSTSGYSAILGTANAISPYLVSISLAISALAFLFKNSLESDTRPVAWFMKYAILILVSLTSVYISLSFLNGLQHIYTIMWNDLNVNDHRLIPLPGTGIAGFDSGENGIIKFIMLSAYFGSCAMLLATLMVREGMILLIIPLLPVFTILSGVGYLRKYTKVLWEIFIEFSIFPFLALLSVYLSELFSSVAPLQIALILIPSLIPGYLFFSGRGPGTTPLLNMLGGISAGAIAGSITGYSRSAVEIGSGNLQDGLLRMMQVPSGNSGSRQPGHAVSRKDPYKEAIQEELKWRRYPD